MVRKLKNRYVRDWFWFYRPLREHVAIPLALCLTALFLFAHPVVACAEMQRQHWSGQPSDTSFSSSDIQSELESDRVENRELNSRRQGAERYPTPKFEFIRVHQEVELLSLLESRSYSFSLTYNHLHGSSLFAAPFSPRPPPIPSFQG